METRDLVIEMVRMLQMQQIIPALDRFYDKDIEVSAIGRQERIHSGKSAGFSSVYNWFMNCLLHDVSVEFIAVDGDNAAIELLVDMTPNGQERHHERIVMLQTWREGKIVHLSNYSKRASA